MTMIKRKINSISFRWNLFFRWSLLWAAGILLSFQTWAEPSGNKKAKSSLNTQIYEREDTTDTFSDKVRLLRDMAGDSQVFFQNHPGVFTIENSENGTRIKNLLLKAKKKNQAVSITVDRDSKVLKEATEKE